MSQGGQIDRQEESGGGVSSPHNTAAHGARHAGVALRIGNKCRVEPPGLDSIARGIFGQHQDDLPARERCEHPQRPAE